MISVFLRGVSLLGNLCHANFITIYGHMEFGSLIKQGGSVAGLLYDVFFLDFSV